MYLAALRAYYSPKDQSLALQVSATSKEKASRHALIRRTKRKGTGSHDLLSSSHTREPLSHLALEVTPIQLASWCAGRAEPLSYMPKEHIRVFLFTSTQQMDAMLQRANQGALSTAIAVKQLWDAHRTSWIEVRRLEVELGEGGDHDQPFEGT